MKRVTIPASLLAGGILIACANVSPPDDDNTAAPNQPTAVHLMSEPETAAPTASAHVEYYGGPVLSNVNVHVVYWNSKVKYQSELDAFYTTITQSEYVDWLDEYDTPKQHIGRGKMSGSLVDTQPSSNVTNQQIQTTLGSLIDAGKLPSPTANDLYMVHFPPGVTVSQDDGSESCVVFCAYHDSFKHGSKDVFYGVIPDLGGACASGCGEKSQVENTTSASSHELVEAMTDPAVGLASGLASPLAWYDSSNGEVADICVGQDATISGFNVQLIWSNAENACIASKSSGSGGGGSGGSGGGGSGGSGGGGSGGSGGGGSGGSGGGGGKCNESEPNDTAAKADKVCSSGTMSGTISTSTDVDWYTFSIAKGKTYTVTLAKRAADFDMTLYHAAASGRLTKVDASSDSKDHGDEQLTHRSAGGGTYLVKVFAPRGAHSTKAYALEVSTQ